MREKLKAWRAAFDELRARLPTGPWPLLAVALFLALGTLYAVESATKTPRAVGGESRPTIQGGRVFQSSKDAVYKEKDTRLSRAEHGFSSSLQEIREELAEMKRELAKIKSLLPGAVGDPSPLGAAATPAKAAPRETNELTQKGGLGSPGPSGPSPGVGAVPGAASSLPIGKDSAGPGGAGPQSPLGGMSGLRSTVRALPRLGLPKRGPPTVSFPVRPEDEGKLAVTLPAGAFVKARMLTGVAAPEGRPYPVLLALDYAHILPGQHRLDLSGCFMISKAQGDLSTERLQMQATRLSCVARSGRMFEREVTGFVADDKDNNFAVAGEVQSKQDRVAIMAFLASVVEGVGKAIQQAQTQDQTTALGGHETVLSGDRQKYALAGGASDAGAQVAAWYLKEAENLLPTINVNSGREVWVVMQEGVSLPSSYFKSASKEGESHDAYSYVTRLLE